MFTIGADPEVFLKKKNRPVSAEGIIKGNKDNPRYVNGYGLQEDNVLAEFSMPPAKDCKTFQEILQNGLKTLAEEIKDYGLELHIVPSEILDDEFLESYQANVGGCDPDYCAYNPGAPNIPPDFYASKMRTAGGHVHVGWEQPKKVSRSKKEKEIIRIVKNMDLFLGIPSVILDKDVRRKEFYGKAGCFRETKYGLEYRVLSNFWIKSKKLIKWVYQNTELAFNYRGKLPKNIQKIINTNNKEEALKIIEAYNIPLP